MNLTNLPDMTQTLPLARWTFLLTGLYALACIPTILLAERLGWSQRPFHLTQMIAVVICFIASAAFLWRTRGTSFDALRWLATAAVVLCGLFLAFFVYVISTFDLGGMG